ncbi:MAG: hypothetical protein ACK6C3_10420 [Gemmatimonadota bacterium]
MSPLPTIALRAIAVRVLAAGAPGAPGAAGAQESAPPAVPGPRAAGGRAPQPDAAQLVRGFFDCQSFNCREFDYVRTEIPWVNWMRDRFDSQVHVLVTSVRNGAGGLDFTVAFIGRERWQGQIDTLRATTLPNDADDVVRRKLVQVIRVGLVRYAAQTPLLSRLNVGILGPAMAPPTPKDVRDPWNYWIFTIGGSGSGTLESRQEDEQASGNFSATRVTEAWRLGLGVSTSYNGRAFQLDSTGARRTFINRTYDGSLYAVRALGPRWSAGLLGSVGYSDFLNEDLILRVQPGIEYNVYPWSQVVRRQLSVMYAAGPVHFDYIRPTIFGLLRETRLQHKLIATLAQRQSWGTLKVTLQGHQFLQDPTKYTLSINGVSNFRLGKGLSINLSGSAAQVRDQLYLPAGGLSQEQILTRQQALATDYVVRFNVGLSYTFGSIYNTVVNQRLNALLGFGRGFNQFGGGGGGGGGR